MPTDQALEIVDGSAHVGDLQSRVCKGFDCRGSLFFQPPSRVGSESRRELAVRRPTPQCQRLLEHRDPLWWILEPTGCGDSVTETGRIEHSSIQAKPIAVAHGMHVGTGFLQARGEIGHRCDAPVRTWARPIRECRRQQFGG